MMKRLLGALAALALLALPVEAQTYVGGMVRTSVPTLPNGSINGLSLDANGYLKVNVSAGGAGGGNVNLTQIGGNAVTVTTPGVLDINCVSGCVAGSGVIQAQATTAAPSYTNATPNPVSQDLSGNLRVIIGNTSIPVTNTGTFAVQAAQSGTWNVVNSAGANIIGKVGIDQTTPGTTNGVQVLTGSTTAVTQATAANLNATVVNAAGAAIIGKVGIDQTTPGTTNLVQVCGSLPAGTNAIGNAGALPLAAPTTTSFHLIAANSTNSTLLSAGGHAVFELSTGNNSANIAYLKVYDKATAPTCGTDTPIGTYIIPGATAGGAGSNVTISLGKAVTLGLGICVTGGIADADTTVVAASAYAIDVTYK